MSSYSSCCYVLLVIWKLIREKVEMTTWKFDSKLVVVAYYTAIHCRLCHIQLFASHCHCTYVTSIGLTILPPSKYACCPTEYVQSLELSAAEDKTATFRPTQFSLGTDIPFCLYKQECNSKSLFKLLN